MGSVSYLEKWGPPIYLQNDQPMFFVRLFRLVLHKGTQKLEICNSVVSHTTETQAILSAAMWRSKWACCFHVPPITTPHSLPGKVNKRRPMVGRAVRWQIMKWGIHMVLNTFANHQSINTSAAYTASTHLDVIQVI